MKRGLKMINNNEELKMEMIIKNAETKERTKESYLTAEEKDEYARNNKKLIYYVIQKLLNLKVDGDLEGAGFLGLTRALNSFDKTKKFKFSTFATTCIKHEILVEIRKQKRHKKNLSFNTAISPSEKGEKEMVIENILSNEAFGDKSLEDSVMMGYEVELLMQSIGFLDPFEKKLIELRYGLNKKENKTQQEVAKILGVTQPTISRMEKCALQKLQILIQKNDNYNSFQLGK